MSSNLEKSPIIKPNELSHLFELRKYSGKNQKCVTTIILHVKY